MEQIIVKVRLDKKNYEDVVVGVISWEEDIALIDACEKSSIDQASMKKETIYDTRLLANSRVAKAIQSHEVSVEQLNKMPKRDRTFLQRAYMSLNEVGEAEKSGPLGEDNERSIPQGQEPESRLDGESVDVGEQRAES